MHDPETPGTIDGRPRSRLLSRGAATVMLIAVLALTGTAAFAVIRSSDPAGDWTERTVVGYVPYWDQERGFAVVHDHIDTFDQVSPMWYSLDSDGNIVLADKEHTRIDHSEVRFLQDHGIQVIPALTNLRGGEWAPQLVSEMLHDPAARDAHIRNIVDLVAAEGYDGIDIDYELLQARDRAAYSAFLRELGEALHAEGKLLTAAVHAKQSRPGPYEHNVAQDYRAIGAAVDQLRVMTYDYHWSTSPPGPVAPLGWVENVVAWTVTQVPADKVVLGAVLLGYDWVVGGEGETVGYRDAMALARRHNVPVSHEGVGSSPTFTYTDARGRKHEVWFEDTTSVEAKLALVEKYDLGGTFFWRLGGEDPRIWTAAGSPP